VSTTGTDGPATPATPATVSEGTYKRLTSGVGQFALAIVACFALVLVAMLISPGNGVLGGAKEILPSADAGQGALELRNIAPYVSWVPRGLPPRWRCTSSRLTTTPVSWHVGYVTPADQYAALEQSDETPPDQFISRMTNVDPTKPSNRKGIREVAGVPWEEYFRVDKKQYSLVRRLPGVTLVVSGTASYDELAVLAGSLQQQPRQSGTATSAPSPTP
jgi:hypothetical protein